MPLPCVIFEDDHLLVVDKPAGLNTHAPGPYAGEGLYDWFKHRESRWANLAIIHRLDKETSGVIVFAKTPLANRSLTDQFTHRQIGKQYVLLTDHDVPQTEFIVRSELIRARGKYVSRPTAAEVTRRSGPAATEATRQSTHFAETLFRHPTADERNSILTRILHAPFENETACKGRRKGSIVGNAPPAATKLTGVQQLPVNLSRSNLLIAEPLTGRTHQIRVHAADRGFPILGDILYGGTQAPRVCLHAVRLSFLHPATGAEASFIAPPDFDADPRLTLRLALLEPELTNAWRCQHGAGDGWPGWYVERLGNYLLSMAERPLDDTQREKLARLAETFAANASYCKILSRHVRRLDRAETCPRLEFGAPAPERFNIRENGLEFELSFQEGYSTGLFLDQRENRLRLLMGYIAAGFELYPGLPNRKESAGNGLKVLNTFAYTCGFSVAAARAGATTTSLDLSRRYLEWGKRNFELNQLDPGAHEFIYGDVFDWFRRLGKKKLRYQVILLDPPTFSQSKESGVFRAEKDFGKLIAGALPLLEPGGVLFASSNAVGWLPEDFLTTISAPIRAAGRTILQQHYVPQPPDFPISRAEKAYLKTVWLRIS